MSIFWEFGGNLRKNVRGKGKRKNSEKFILFLREYFIENNKLMYKIK
jgi:hypothetical protein